VEKLFFFKNKEYIPRSIYIDIPFNQIPLFDNDDEQDIDTTIGTDPIFKNISWTKDPGPYNMYARGDDIQDIYDYIDNHEYNNHSYYQQSD